MLGYYTSTYHHLCLVLLLLVVVLHPLIAVPITRLLHPTTTHRNHRPFCGNNEFEPVNTVRKRRSLPAGTGLGVFPGKALRYGVLKYPRHDLHKNMTRQELRRYVDEALKEAIKLWSEVIDVEFVEWKGRNSDIQVSFSTFYHGDEYPFDGIGNEVAHAFYPSHPQRRGQIHIDDNEPWGPNGRNLKWVMAHEIGHSLGLPHTLHDSIMMPDYGGYEESNPHLFPYDINIIQAMYGKRKGFDENMLLKKQTTSVPSPEVSISLCDRKPFDTIFALPNNTVVVFKGTNFWTIDNIENASYIVGPLPIGEFFGQIQLPLDAAFTDHLDWTWLIKGDQAWRVDASTDVLRLFAPEEFHETAPFSNYIYNSVDAILSVRTFTENDENVQPIFFFLGPKYWYDGNSDDGTDAGYRRQIKEIDYRLKNIDEALSTPSGNFIVSGDLYWKVEPSRNSLKAIKRYPRSVRKDWFGCQ